MDQLKSTPQSTHRCETLQTATRAKYYTDRPTDRTSCFPLSTLHIRPSLINQHLLCFLFILLVVKNKMVQQLLSLMKVSTSMHFPFCPLLILALLIHFQPICQLRQQLRYVSL